MSLVRRNILANIAGKGWAALMSIALIPVYIRFLGIEAYGLVGVYLALYGVMSLLDFGLGTTLNRELARISVQRGSGQSMRDLLRTLETAYWTIGIVCGLAVVALAPAIASNWVKAEELPHSSVQQALVLMGIALACQWPLALYTGGLMGLQRQVVQNVISASAMTLRSVGAVLVLWQVSPTIEAFLVWQLVSSLAETLVTAFALWRSLPGASVSPRFRWTLISGVWRFAAGVTGISVSAVILTQLDKIILSSLLSLEMFGYYTLASRVSGGLYYLINPVVAAFFPRFSQLFALEGGRELGRIYHQACQLMSVVILPAAVVLVLFSHELLLLWTQDSAIAENTYRVLSLLSVGTALNALASLPYALQLASGWTRLTLIVNAAAALLLAPMIYFMSIRYGAVGAAIVWVIMNAGYVLVVTALMHRRLLQGELWRWYWFDTAWPLVAALAVGGAWKWLVPFSGAVWADLANLILVSLATVAAATLAAPEARAQAIRWLAARPRSANG